MLVVVVCVHDVKQVILAAILLNDSLRFRFNAYRVQPTRLASIVLYPSSDNLLESAQVNHVDADKEEHELEYIKITLRAFVCLHGEQRAQLINR